MVIGWFRGARDNNISLKFLPSLSRHPAISTFLPGPLRCRDSEVQLYVKKVLEFTAYQFDFFRHQQSIVGFNIRHTESFTLGTDNYLAHSNEYGRVPTNTDFWCEENDVLLKRSEGILP